MRAAIILVPFLCAGTAFGQAFDITRNSSLHGDYFIREVLIAGQNSDGTITSAKSAIGLATFDGKGGYRFTGTSGAAATGVYGVGANGLLYIQSVADSTQNAYGGLSAIGPTAFVASATEGTSADLLVAIPAGTATSAASLQGAWSGGYVSFPGAAVSMVREASFSLTADGAGNIPNMAVSGAALNLGGTTVSQTVTGGTYTLSGEGIGSISLGAASQTQVLSGSLTLYLSADGNLFIAGTPGGYDLIVGMKSLTATATNATWNSVYFTGAMEDAVANGATPVHAIDAFYGSWNANGAGISISHDRFQGLAAPPVFDFTFDSQWAVQPNGTVMPSNVPYRITLGAGGQAFVGTGSNGLYSLLVGFGAQKFSGTGVYLNPLGIVNAASFAPITAPIAPGELITLFGSGLSAGVVSATNLPLPTSLGNVQVMINGHAAPLVYVTPTQIVAQVPQTVTPANQALNARIQVNNNNVLSNGVTVYTNYTAPGVFTVGGGVGFAAAERQNLSVITASNPANIGETIVLYASGLGAVNPPVNDGAPAPSTVPLATTVDTDVVNLGGLPGTGKVVFNGLTPGLAGLYQLNTTILHGTPTGTVFADISTPDAYTSQAVVAVSGTSSMAVRPQGLVARPEARRAGLPERSTTRQ